MFGAFWNAYGISVACVGVCVCVAAYSIQGQNVQIISPSSESHQQVVAVGQPLSAQPQGTVVVRQKYYQMLIAIYISCLLNTDG